jgi:uncharacterized membrane protein YedE/YeeE
MVATEFTPLSALAGGALIGLSAAMLMLGNGRIAGASGIFAGLFSFSFDGEFMWRLIFIIGMLAGSLGAAHFAFDASSLAFEGGQARTVAAGLLVGVGTVLGSGCTSGHGICGLSRFSIRSLVATCTFMAVAIVTVFITRQVMGA